MAAKKRSTGNHTSPPHTEQVSFSVEPGTKVKIIVDVGEQAADGKVPLRLHIEQVAGVESMQADAVPARHWPVLEALRNRLSAYDLVTWLFFLALAIYLVTRLIGLTQFPIYFFTDEAIQSLSMVDLIENGYRDPSGVLLPTYFRNGEYYNIGLSVYLQWLPAVLFGKSAVATRAMSVLVTMIAAVSVGIILRDIFKIKHWWAGTLFLSITPAWFLHSRTAFETAEFVAFYAGALCAYLFYRHKSPRFFYLVVLLGALAFYSYSPAQMIMPLTALLLLLSDWRYHWENRRTVFLGVALAAILALPYIRASINNPSAPFAHLHTLWSYWFEDIPLSEKIGRYFSEFGVGLSPWYWYVPNDRDLSRHLMKGYGNIMIATLPFALLGVAHALRDLHRSAYRALLVALLVSPAAAALVQVSITRSLVFVVPAAILTAIGLEHVLGWIEDPKKRLGELSERPGPTPIRIAAGLVILMVGIFVGSILLDGISQFAVLFLAILLALQTSGLLERMAQSLTHRGALPTLDLWKLSPSIVAVFTFVILAAANLRMLSDALRNGPLWFRDYGLGGMQYGGFQIFDILDEYKREHPETKIIFSPDWANGADVVARFFLDDFSAVQIGSVRGHLTQKLPLDEDTLFIMTPQEYDLVNQSDKLKDIQVESIVPYPDGSPGFYFVRLRYTDRIDEIFAEEKAVRTALREAVLNIDGEDVDVRFSYLDGEFQEKSMALVFDDDPFTVAKTFETNPFIIEMTFPSPRTLSGFSIIIGSAHIRITMKCYPGPGAEPTIYTFEGQGTRNQPELSFDLPAPTESQVLYMEVLDPYTSEQSKVHIWELDLR